MPEFDRVAIVGNGTAGGVIAQVVAQAGVQVTAVDFADRTLDAVPEGIRRTTSITDIADAQLVIEAVADDRDAKAAVLSAVGQVAGAGTIVVTTTSSLSVSDLAGLVPRPENFAGLHFLHPIDQINVVEVVAALQSSPDALDRIAAFVTDVGRDPVPVKDRPGFLINRLLLPYLNDVIQAYDDGLATADDLDTAIRLGLGYQRGPLELLESIGLDVHERNTRRAFDALHDPVYAPPPLLQAMVAAGGFGDGNGFRNLEASK